MHQLYWWLRTITDHISVHYTHTFYMYKSRFRGASGTRRRRNFLVLCGSASPALASYPAHGGWEAGPAPSLRIPAASVAQRRLISSRRRLQPTCAPALVNWTALHATIAAAWRVCGHGLDTRAHWRGVRGLGAVGHQLGRRHRSVEGAVNSAVRRVQEKVRKCGASGQGTAGRRAHGCQTLKWAGGGKGRQLTPGRSSEKSSIFTSCCSRRLLDGVHGCTLTSAERDHDGVNVQFARLSICDGDGCEGR